MVILNILNLIPVSTFISTEVFIYILSCSLYTSKYLLGPLWSWSYGSCIYNYMCNQYLSPLTLWGRILLYITLHDKICQWLETGRSFLTDTPVSRTNETDRHDITEILLKVALNSINLSLNHTKILLTGPLDVFHLHHFNWKQHKNIVI